MLTIVKISKQMFIPYRMSESIKRPYRSRVTAFKHDADALKDAVTLYSGLKNSKHAVCVIQIFEFPPFGGGD